LQKKVNEDRERNLRALMQASAETDRKLSERYLAEAREQQAAELHKNIEALQQQAQAIHIPPLIEMDTRPIVGRPVTPGAAPAPEPHVSARELPPELVVADADIAASALHQAPAADISDRAARKELQHSLDTLHADLKALAAKDHFTDESKVAALAPRVDEARARAAALMKDRDHRKMVLRSLDDLARNVRDFATPPPKSP
jgi:hypothetical protein